MADYVLCLVYDPRTGRLSLDQLSDDEIRKRIKVGQRVLRDPASERDNDIRDVYNQETDGDRYKRLIDRIKRRPKTT